MDERNKFLKKFRKAVQDNVYLHTGEELNEELLFAFDWFWNQTKKDREDAWKYRDLCK